MAMLLEQGIGRTNISVLSPDMQIETGYNRIITIAKPPAEVARMSLEYLRLAAETYYVTDLNSIKIEELWELPQFNNLAIHKLMMWCHDYGWTEKRKVFQEKCILKVQEAVSNKLVKLRIEQMDKVKELCDDIWEKVSKGNYDQVSIFGKRTKYNNQCALPQNMRSGPCITDGVRLDSISVCDENARNPQTSLEVKKAKVVKKVERAVQASRMPEITLSLPAALGLLKDRGFWVYGADMQGQPCHVIDLAGRVCLVLGGEGSGLHRLVRERCDALVAIPSVGHVDSFNVSVAAGILLYEVRRQQGFPNRGRR